MGVLTHEFVSAVADGGDATLVRPSNWNASHSITADASVKVTDGDLIEPLRYTLSGTNRLTLANTGRLFLFGFTDDRCYNIMGRPKAIQDTPWRIPTGFQEDLLVRLTMLAGTRGILEGTADLILTDDFATRSRIVLLGRG